MNKRHAPTALEENKTTEFKEVWSDEALKALAALSNTNGGTLYIGINDKGQPVGWKGTKKELDAVANSISDKLRIHPDITTDVQNGHKIIAIEVPSSTTPIAFSGRYYHRVGSTTREIPAENLGHFFIAKMGVKWDGLQDDYDLKEIDNETFRRFISLAQKRLPHISAKEPMKRIFEKLELIQDGKLTRGAIMLFGKNPQHHFLMAQIHMGRFKTDMTIVDDKLINGNLFQQLDQATELFRKYLNVGYAFHKEIGNKSALEAMQHIEVWDYPLDALREAVINALIHRDYFESSSDIQIRVYDDRVTISNPGTLPSKLKIKDLKREGHLSVPRNPLLAQGFYFANFIERWGYGTTNIVKLCRQQGLPDPEFQVDPYTFKIEFAKNPYTEERLQRMGLNDRQIKAVFWVKEKGNITNTEYQKLTGTKHRTAALELGALLSKGIVVKIGTTGRGTSYRLNVRNVQ